MKRILLILTIAVLTVSCEKNLSDLNENKKDPVDVDGESMFMATQKRLADQILTPNVNLNNLRLWVQYWQETTYTDESRYDQTTRTIPDNHWDVMYQDVLGNLEDAASRIMAEDENETNDLKPGKIGIIRIMKAYAYANLIETYGNVPFEEALDIDNQTPKYDDAQETYYKVIDTLTTGIEQLGNYDGAAPFTDAQDNIYQGNVDNWIKFGNTLKLRMAMVLSDVDKANAKKIAQEAIDGGVFVTNDDDAEFAYQESAPNNHPLNNELVLSGRDDYVGAETLVDMMNDLNDPRRASYFDPNLSKNLGEVTGFSGTTIKVSGFEDTPSKGDPVFMVQGSEVWSLVGIITSVGSNTLTVGEIVNEPGAGDELIAGSYSGGVIGENSNYDNYSHANRAMVEADRPGNILSNVEGKFLQAEAAQRFGIGNAEEFYNEAIKASFEAWGVPGFTDYIKRSDVKYNQGDWKKSLGTQAWIGLYDKTFAPYIMVRRLDQPALKQPHRALSGFPNRYTYTVNAQSLNEPNWEEASSAIGGDEPETRLFWDTEDPNWPGWD